MSAWTMIAEAIAAKYGVEDDLFVRDRIGKINEDRMNDREVSAKEFKNGSDGVQFGGKGVGGNAVARFGDGENSDEAAAEFAAIINSIKQVGLAEEILVEDTFDFNNLALGAGAIGTKENVGRFEDIEFNYKEFNDGTHNVRTGGEDVGGNANAKFAATPEGEAQALAFQSLLNSLDDLGFSDEILL